MQNHTQDLCAGTTSHPGCDYLLLMWVCVCAYVAWGAVHEHLSPMGHLLRRVPIHTQMAAVFSGVHCCRGLVGGHEEGLQFALSLPEVLAVHRRI